MKHIYLLLILLFVAGCGGNVQMGGRVTYSDTGEPVELGTVVFSSPTRQSRGEIKEDGKYVIGTFGDKDGLPRGEYSVTVFAVKSVVEDANGRISDSTTPPQAAGLNGGEKLPVVDYCRT